MGRLEIVQALVDRGADMRTPTKRGMTALDLAIDKGATELFQEGWTDFIPHFKIANQTMVWHGNTAKNPTRISLIHRYMRRHRCNLASGVTCDRGREIGTVRRNTHGK